MLLLWVCSLRTQVNLKPMIRGVIWTLTIDRGDICSHYTVIHHAALQSELPAPLKNKAPSDLFAVRILFHSSLGEI